MTPSKKILLVGWDAADWKVIHPLLDAGKMPNVQRLVEGGVMGSVATLYPPLSPMLWTSIATGKRPYKHGIHGFTEPTADGLGIQPISNLSRTCKAIWNILNQNGLRSIVIGWWPSHPAEPLAGVTVSDHYHRAFGPLDKGWPLLSGAVHPPELRDELAALRFHPDEVVPEMVAPFVPRYAEIDQDKDRRLAGLMKTLCECASIHSCATHLLDTQAWDFFAVYYDAIDHFCHGFMKYHPPRQEFIPERDFDLYHNVVTMAYQFHDQMLGTLLSKVGDDVTVILMSDHGFHPDHLRPRAIPRIPAGPAIEHRDFGILAIKGPGIKKDELLHGPSVLDITPTILALYDLPVGADMDGKVLVGAFETPPPVKTIPSWDDVPGADGRHPPDTRLDPTSAREALEQLIALGYIQRPDENREKAVADTVAELRCNLGESLQDAGRHAQALEIFRALHAKDADEQRFAVRRFVSAQALGRTAEMAEVVADLDGRRRGLYLEALLQAKDFNERIRKRLQERKAKNQAAMDEATNPPPDGEAATEKELEKLLSPEERKERERLLNLLRFDPPLVDYLKAQVRTAEKKYEEALALLQSVQEGHLARPGLYLQTGNLYLRLNRLEEAQQTFAQALSADPDNPHAHLGLGRVALRQRRFEAAARAALESVQRLYQNPLAHFLLGVAMTGLKEYERAAEAYRAALMLNPNFPQAHLRLAWLLRRRLGDEKQALEHFRLFYQLCKPARKKREEDGPATSAVVPKAVEPAEAVPAVEPAEVALPASAEAITVVSGLPRSGTSMLMQMLTVGGLPALTDGVRAADDDNPRGYFEYEPVKTIYQKNDWLQHAKGKVVKIVAPLLPYLPAGLEYRVVFLDRNLDEVLASQGQMLARRGEPLPDTPERRSRLKEEFRRLVQKVKENLARRPDVRLLALNHAEVVSDARTAAERLNRFVGGGLAVEAMAAEVKPALHRQRGT